MQNSLVCTTAVPKTFAISASFLGIYQSIFPSIFLFLSLLRYAISRRNEELSFVLKKCLIKTDQKESEN